MTGSHLDFGARIYDSRLGRWSSPDTFKRLYVPISPYVFALNTPIKLRDADGNIVVDEKGRPVTVSITKNEDNTYNATFKLEDGSDVTEEFMNNGGRVIQSAIQVQTGREQVEKVIASNDMIHTTLDDKVEIGKDIDGREGLLLGTTSSNERRFEFNEETGESGLSDIQYIKVEIHTGSINEELKKGLSASETVRGLDTEEAIGTVASHEFEHATNPVDRTVLINEKGKITPKDHKTAERKGYDAASEFRRKPNK